MKFPTGSYSLVGFIGFWLQEAHDDDNSGATKMKLFCDFIKANSQELISQASRNCTVYLLKKKQVRKAQRPPSIAEGGEKPAFFQVRRDAAKATRDREKTNESRSQQPNLNKLDERDYTGAWEQHLLQCRIQGDGIKPTRDPCPSWEEDGNSRQLAEMLFFLMQREVCKKDHIVTTSEDHKINLTESGSATLEFTISYADGAVTVEPALSHKGKPAQASPKAQADVGEEVSSWAGQGFGRSEAYDVGSSAPLGANEPRHVFPSSSYDLHDRTFWLRAKNDIDAAFVALNMPSSIDLSFESLRRPLAQFLAEEQFVGVYDFEFEMDTGSFARLDPNSAKHLERRLSLNSNQLKMQYSPSLRMKSSSVTSCFVPSAHV